MLKKSRKVLVCGIALLVSSYAIADTTMYVSPGGDGTDPTSGDWTKAYKHPQTAIDAADGTTPTTVIIDDGTYACQDNATQVGVITIGKGNITLKARNDKQAIIDGGTGDANSTTLVRRCITVEASLTGVVVEGLVFKNGVMTYNKDKTASTALVQSGEFKNCEFYGYCRRRNNMMHFTGMAVARNCLFTSTATSAYNSCSGDWALYVAGNAQIIDSVIRDFDWYASGLGYNVKVEGSAVVKGCSISGLKAGNANTISSTHGFGSMTGDNVYLTGSGTLEDCVITNNLIFGSAGGVYVDSKNAAIRNCKIWGNTAMATYDNLMVKAGVTPTITGTAAPELAADDKGNTDFDPFSEFCTVGNVTVGKAPFAVTFRNRTGDESAIWDFGDGTGTTVGAMREHTYETPGVYTVTMTLGGVPTVRTGYITVTPAKMYVSKTGAGIAPYATPEDAAKHPQDAIDLAPAGAGTEIEIDDGVYTVRDTKDYSVLVINKGGIDLKAKNGRGKVWIDSQRTTGNGYVRRNLTVGGGLADVTVSGLVLTNGWMAYSTSTGPSTALIGAGVLTNCVFDLYCFSRCTTMQVGGTTQIIGCDFTSVAVYNHSPQNNDYGVDLSGSALISHSRFLGLDRTGKYNYALPFVMVSGANAVLRNCLVTGYKGGESTQSACCGAVYASKGTIENCTIVGNSVQGGKGGGVWLTSPAVVFRNNIVWGNTATGGGDNLYAEDYSGCTFSAAPELTTPGKDDPQTGNLKLTANEDPGFVDYAGGNFLLKAESLCTGSGAVNEDWMTESVDLLGQPRLFNGSVSKGAYEPQERSSGLIGDFSIVEGFGAAPFKAKFTASITGGTGSYSYKWDFGDGSTTAYSPADGTIEHTYTAVGTYDVTLAVSDGETETVFGPKSRFATAVGEVCYARPDQEGESPYDTWEKATSNLQAAVDLRPKFVLATNGTYIVDHSEGKNLGLTLDYPVKVRSLEGPLVTLIRGSYNANPSTRPNFEKHVVTIRNGGASVEGFRLERGFPPLLYANAGLVANCIITNSYIGENQDINYVFGTAIVSNCVFDATGADDGHVNASRNPVTLSGSARLINCEVRNLTMNESKAGVTVRGGIYASGSSIVHNCYVHDIRYVLPVADNTGNAGIVAAGSATVENCTVRNCWSKENPEGGLRVKSSTATVRNSIFWGNTGGADETPIDIKVDIATKAFENCLVGAGELPETAKGCIVGEDPCFADDGSGYRITKDSPCYNKGTAVSWASKKGLATDIDGQERHCGPIDIGCWELQRPLGLLLLVW